MMKHVTAVSPLVIWTALMAATLPCLCTGSGPSSEVFNFDVAFEEFSRDMAKDHKTTVQWTDCWYNRSELRAHKIYRGYQATLQAGPFRLGPVEATKRPPSLAYRQVFVNNQTTKVDARVSESREREETTKMSTLFAFECNISGSMHLNFKEAVRAGGGFSVNFRTDKLHTETEVVTRTIDIDLHVEVPPQSEVTVEWHVTEITKRIPWSMEMIARGYCAVQFKNEVLLKRLHFIGVDFVASKHPRLHRRGNGEVTYMTTGVMETIATLEHHVYVRETKKRDSNRPCRPAKARQHRSGRKRKP